MPDTDAPYVYALGDCHRCGAAICCLVDNFASQQESDVRCGSCGRITVVREYEPVMGRGQTQ